MTHVARRRITEDDYVVTESGCWEWKHYRLPDGYGQMRVGPRTVRAHVQAYRQAKGPVPTGTCVCHSCDNPPCVNPDHLWAGTQLDNIADRHAKGRSRGGRLSGEQLPHTKLSQAQVDAIRISAGLGNSQRKLAARFGISKSQVGRILRQENWA